MVFPRNTAALPARAVRRMDSYKVSKRRELDISITAAAFVVDTDASGVVTHARLAFGGVAATPARATKTEAYLLGKKWDERTVASASEILAGEFTPLDDHRSGAAYRRDLVVSLFEKFFRGEKSNPQDELLVFEPTPRSTCAADDASRALEHESAVGHVTGGALYVDDVGVRRDMLEIWPVSSPHARARVISIDTSEAAKAPGVAVVLTAKDVPGMNDVGAVRHDEPLFAAEGGEASFRGHVVAMVVGESYEACRARRREGEGRVRAATAGDRRSARRWRSTASTPSRTSSVAATARRRSPGARIASPASSRSAGRSTSTSSRTRAGRSRARTARSSSPRRRSTRPRCKPSSRTCSTSRATR